jgi:serine/threonine-protein kinase
MLDIGSWRARPQARGAAGATVCGWRVDKRLEGGQVCETFLATRGAETAAVRVLLEPFASDEQTRADWLRASWAANRFHHARVAKVIEEGVDDGRPFIVRAWARGEALDEAVRRGALDAAGALRLFEQLLDALELAHAHGIVHGAITPHNVIVTPRGSMRLVDFATTPGLLGARVGIADALAAARVTEFTAPEQRTGALDEQSDVWSVGACLAFVLEALPPSSADVRAVVELALAREPADRYESAYAMLGDVRRLMAGRKPKLTAAHAPVPSQSVVDADALVRSLPASSSGMAELATPTPEVAPARRAWAMNLLLLLAIAGLVGLATFVMVRERLSDPPAQSP